MITSSTSGQNPPVADQQPYILSSRVFGTEHLNPVITYQWAKDGDNIGMNSSNYSITTLRLSDNGEYVCKLTISSSYLNGDHITSGSLVVRIQSMS